MGIAAGAEDAASDGTELELKGNVRDLESTVDFKAAGSGMTAINVYAQESTVEWDREYAREVLSAIIARL